MQLQWLWVGKEIAAVVNNSGDNNDKIIWNKPMLMQEKSTNTESGFGSVNPNSICSI